MTECWHSDSESPTIAGVSSDSLTDRYCSTDIHRPHLWSWQLEDSNLNSNNLDSLAGLQMCTWARVGSHKCGTDLCRMDVMFWLDLSGMATTSLLCMLLSEFLLEILLCSDWAFISTWGFLEWHWFWAFCSCHLRRRYVVRGCSGWCRE